MKQNLRTFLVPMLCAAWCPTWVLADEATLPFTFEGTKADIATTAGLSESGLGPDNYSNPYLQFDDTGDCVILQIGERPGTLSFDLMGRNFSGGSFTVQASEDGVNYTDLRTYTNFGPSPHMLRGIFDDLDTDVRYIKWIYTEKVEGNVFLGRIRLDEFSTHPDLYISDVTIKAGEDQPLEVHTLSDGALSFNSENNDIAWVEFVDGAYILHAVGIGETDITVYQEASGDFTEETTDFTVTVLDLDAVIDEPFEFTINEAATDGTACYATISNLGAGNFWVSADVEVSTIAIVDGHLTYPQTFHGGDIIPGQGAYLVKGAADTYTFDPAEDSDAITLEGNMLYSTGDGNLSAAEMAAAHDGAHLFYKLTLLNGKVGFYWGAEDGAAFHYTKGHQAYIAVPKTDGAQGASSFLFDAETSGIDGVAATAADASTYTLTGLRIADQALRKGIYIRNGKKVIMK